MRIDPAIVNDTDFNRRRMRLALRLTTIAVIITGLVLFGLLWQALVTGPVPRAMWACCAAQLFASAMYSTSMALWFLSRTVCPMRGVITVESRRRPIRIRFEYHADALGEVYTAYTRRWRTRRPVVLDSPLTGVWLDILRPGQTVDIGGQTIDPLALEGERRRREASRREAEQRLQLKP